MDCKYGHCDTEICEVDKFCSECGAKLHSEEKERKMN